jgi:hypothetical protein
MTLQLSRIRYAKYCGKGLWVAFFTDDEWYLYPHDEVLEHVLANLNIGNTRSWLERGGYSFPSLSKELRSLLAPYKITGDTQPVPDAPS